MIVATPSPEMPNRKPVLLLLAITLLAAALRIPTVGIALHGDEAANFSWYSFVPWRDLIFDYTNSNQHTLLIALSRLCMSLFGENEISFRLPSLLAGVFAVPMLYVLSTRLLNSQAVALTASALLTFSFHPLKYSQEGRAYSLTILLACALVYVVTQLNEKENRPWWGVGLVALGLSMVFALPSNAYFLAGASVFFILERWKREGRTLLRPGFLKELTPFLILFTLILAYFYVIAPGLRKSVVFAQYYFKEHSDHGLRLDWGSLTSLCGYLVEPWGTWIYLFFAYGLVILRREGRLIAFLMLFLIPAALHLSSGLAGPSRVSLYWEPFIFFGVAVGLVELIADVNKRLHNVPKTLLPTLLILTLLIPPILKLSFYYRYQADIPGVSMADARQTLDYLKEKHTRHQLVVYQNQVLTHWLGQLAMESNFSVLRDGKLDDVIFITTRHKPPQDIHLIKSESNRPTPFPANSLQLLAKLGDVRVHRLGAEIINFAPALPNPDFEDIYPAVDNPSFTLSYAENSKLLGKHSLLATNNTTDNWGILGSTFSMASDANDNLLLLVYAKKYSQRGEMSIVRTNIPEHEGEMAVESREIFWLDYRNTVFTLENDRVVWQNISPFDFHHFMAGIIEPHPENFWEMKIALYPVAKGNYQITPQIILGGSFFNNRGTFDGLQMYHLKQH